MQNRTILLCCTTLLFFTRHLSADDGFNTYLGGSITAYSNGGSSSAMIANNQDVSTQSPDGASQVQAFNSLSTANGQINFNFNASTQIYSASGLRDGLASVEFTFVTSAPMNFTFGGSAHDSTNANGAFVYLRHGDTGQPVGYFGQYSTFPDSQPSGQFQGVLPAGSYELRADLDLGTDQFAASAEGDYSGYFTLGVPEPSTWLAGVLLTCIAIAFTIRRPGLTTRSSERLMAVGVSLHSTSTAP